MRVKYVLRAMWYSYLDVRFAVWPERRIDIMESDVEVR